MYRVVCIKVIAARARAYFGKLFGRFEATVVVVARAHDPVNVIVGHNYGDYVHRMILSRNSSAFNSPTSVEVIDANVKQSPD